MPSAESKGLENFWYSWGYGMVHFIQFNSETDFPNAPDEPGGEGLEFAGPFAPNGTQLAWLEEDLKKVDRKKTPWIIVGGHRPCMTASRHDMLNSANRLKGTFRARLVPSANLHSNLSS
jgi:hypothetical protein